MFEKLNIILPDLDIHRLKDDGAQLDQRYPSNFKEYEIKDQNYLRSLFEFDLGWDDANITVFKSGGGKLPHTDSWSTALNYYIAAEQATTTFYANPTGHKIAYEALPGLDMYNLNQLIPVAEFYAVSGDCYLVNTKIPHNVTDKYTGSRILLRLVWYNEPYQSVLDKIRRCYGW